MPRRLVAAAAALAAVGGLAAPAVAAHTPAAQPDRLMPMAACVGSNIWLTYPTDTASCDAAPPQQIHIRYVPSTWTLAAAESYCAAHGSHIYGLFAATANVCPNIDY